MLIIVDGVDGAGKTTLIDGLKDHFGIKYVIHFSKPPIGGTQAQYGYELGLFTAAISIIKQLLSNNQTVILDRSHFSTYAYGPVKRGYSFLAATQFLEYVEDLLLESIPRSDILTILLSVYPKTTIDRGKVGPGEYVESFEEAEVIIERYYESMQKTKLPVTLIRTDNKLATKEAVLKWVVDDIVNRQ